MATLQYLNTKHGRTEYMLAGNPDGDKVFLIHGIGGGAHSYHFMRPYLESDFLVLTLSLYGRCGSSNPPDPHIGSFFVDQMDELVTALGWDSFGLLGHSMGGALVQLYAQQYPAKVTKMVMISPAGVRWPLPFGSSFLTLPYCGSGIIWAMQTMFVEASVRKEFFRPEDCEDIIDWIVARRKERQFPSFSNAFCNSFTHFPLTSMEDVVQQVGQHDRPTLLIWGEHDDVVSFSHCFSVYDGHYAQAEKVIVSNAKHSPHYDRMEEIMPRFAAFFQGNIRQGETYRI